MFTCCLFVSFCSPSIQRSFRSLSAIFKFFSQPYNRTSCVVRSTCTRQPLCSSNKATLGWCWLHDISLSKPVEFHFHYKSPWILPTATLLSKLVAAGRNSMLSCCPKAHYFLMPRMMACGHFPCHCKKKLFESAPLSSSQSSWMYWIAASEVVCVLETSSKKTSTRLPIAKWLLIHRLHTETPVNFCSLNQNCLKSVHNPEKKRFQIAMSLTLRPEDVSFIEFYHWTWVTCQIYSRLTTWQSRIVRPSFFRSICISNFLVNLTDPFHRSTPSARSTLPRLVRMSSAQTAGDTLRRWPGERSKLVHFPHVRMLASAKETWRNEKEISNPHWCSTGGHPKLPMRVSRCSRRSAMDLSVPRTSQSNSFQFLHDHRTIGPSTAFLIWEEFSFQQHIIVYVWSHFYQPHSRFDA